MEKNDIPAYFGRLDKELTTPSVLYIHGNAAVILSGADERTSLGIDLAGPYSSVNGAAFAETSAAAGLPVNPASEDEVKFLADAALLLFSLPENYASQRAPGRLAIFQAKSRARVMPAFTRGVRGRLGRPALADTTVPARLVRDIAPPPLARR